MHYKTISDPKFITKYT